MGWEEWMIMSFRCSRNHPGVPVQAKARPVSHQRVQAGFFRFQPWHYLPMGTV